MKPLALLSASALVLASLSPASAQETGILHLTSITTPIVPTAVITGDREFGGNGPNMYIGVTLEVGRGGRAIFAHVEFSARETGGDGSFTRTEETFEVWRWQPSDGARFVSRIDRPVWGTVVLSRPTCAGTCLGSEDGALMMTVDADSTGPVHMVRLIGDTMGDDISDDSNPHGDTSIRAIVFNPLTVEFTSG